MKTISPLRNAVILSILTIALAIPGWAAVGDADGVPDEAPDEAVLGPPATDSARADTAEILLPWDGISLVVEGICQCVQDCFYYPDPNPCIAWCCANDRTCRSACY